MEAGYDDSGSGRVWSGLILVVAVILTVFGGVLLAMMDADQVVLVPPSPTLEADSVSTMSGTIEVIIISLPSPTSQPTAVQPPDPEPTAIQTPDAGPTAEPTTEPTLEPTAEPTAVPAATTEPQPSSTPAVILERCTPPEAWVPYTVSFGDTLFYLARQGGVEVDAVREANCLTSDELYSGSILYLPSAPPQPMPGCGPPSNWPIYTVQAGDTLYSLATRSGIVVPEVVFANCMTSTSIRAGMRLWLPSSPAPPAGTAGAPTPEPSQPAGTACLISGPAAGSEVSGAVTFTGSASTEDFFFYKLEASGPGTAGGWASLLGYTVSTPVTNGALGTADLTLWEPGNYAIRLVVVDSTRNEAAACTSSLQIVAP